MKATQFFLNSKLVQSVMISALILASKFFCEGQDVVVNSDIARLLNYPPSKLNQMESTMIKLLDFNLYVSTLKYNNAANLINISVKNHS